MEEMINIEYPKSLANTLRLNSKDFASEMKVSSLVKLFELGKVSSGVAARVLGISRVDFFEILSKYHVPVLGEYDENDLNDEVANA